MNDAKKLDLILSKIDKLGNEIKDVRVTLENEIKDVKATLESEIKDVRNEIKDVRVILENEIRTNIMRVAEGHLDLSRNLKEAIKTNNDYEMLTLKVNTLESKVGEIEKKIS